MKSKIFKEVLNEEYIEVNKTVPETIRCLCEQSNFSRDNDVYFECTKKGEIRTLCSSVKFPIYRVSGDVFSKDGKTYVKITSVYNKWDIFDRVFSMVLNILPYAALILILCFGKINDPYLFALAVAGVAIGIIMPIFKMKRRRKRGPELVEKMENEIKRRVKNIERWDD